MTRMQGQGIDMRALIKLIKEIFAPMNTHENRREPVPGSRSLRLVKGTKTVNHYKWWGDDRYEPI